MKVESFNLNSSRSCLSAIWHEIASWKYFVYLKLGACKLVKTAGEFVGGFSISDRANSIEELFATIIAFPSYIFPSRGLVMNSLTDAESRPCITSTFLPIVSIGTLSGKRLGRFVFECIASLNLKLIKHRVLIGKSNGSHCKLSETKTNLGKFRFVLVKRVNSLLILASPPPFGIPPLPPFLVALGSDGMFRYTKNETVADKEVIGCLSGSWFATLVLVSMICLSSSTTCALTTRLVDSSCATSFSSFTPSRIEFPKAKTSNVTPSTTIAINRDSSLWCSSFSFFFRPAGWWCSHHSPPHPTATSNAARISNETQNQNEGNRKKPSDKKIIVATIREIIFGILLFVAICIFWVNWFSGDDRKK
jgi:hypothetical protein